ncbi:hypothetical protein N656DRAFT_653197 [Canariomyces notabilis]|uniref:Uncharacterized protein n=1 Tax=Canariomyces notabilis TaxID=2074819 RepID=A0AAN6TF35_9PEZI|nr:hypothetical protein N656DRAFT_653197 [Canariomyces arenarius]
MAGLTPNPISSSPIPATHKLVNSRPGKTPRPGTTGVTVYTGLDPNKVLILLIMMPYGTGTTNETKVAFYDKSNTTVNQDLVEHVSNNGVAGENAEWSWSEEGKTHSVYVASKIGQGNNVTATFTVRLKKLMGQEPELPGSTTPGGR